MSEWVIDRYAPDFYAKPVDGPLPVNLPGDARYPHVVRGGSWKEKAPALRCAARRFSEPIWSKQDPQTPQSIWWHTETTEVGFRLVHVPDEYPALRGFRSKMTDGEREQVSPVVPQGKGQQHEGQERASWTAVDSTAAGATC